jgi:hypothetical protein
LSKGGDIFPDDQAILDSGLSIETPEERLFEIATDPPHSEMSLVALVILKEAHGERVVENVWWRSKSDKVRKLAFFLMLSGGVDAVSVEGKKIHFVKLCEQFNEQTKRERTTEIEMVYSRLSLIMERYQEVVRLLRLQ